MIAVLFQGKILDFITWKENNAKVVVQVNGTLSGVPAATRLNNMNSSVD